MAELFVFEGQADYDHPIRVAIAFNDGSSIRLRGKGDGERVIVDRLPLEAPVDLLEYGRTEIFDMIEIMNKYLINVENYYPLVINNCEDKMIGQAFTRFESEPFCIWMDGDEFHWGLPFDHSNFKMAGRDDMRIGERLEF